MSVSYCVLWHESISAVSRLYSDLLSCLSDWSKYIKGNTSYSLGLRQEFGIVGGTNLTMCNTSNYLRNRMVSESTYFSTNHCTKNLSFIQLSISSTFYVRHFHAKVFCTAFQCIQFGFVIFWHKNISTKATRKMLMNLTLVLRVLFFCARSKPEHTLHHLKHKEDFVARILEPGNVFVFITLSPQIC